MLQCLALLLCEIPTGVKGGFHGHLILGGKKKAPAGGLGRGSEAVGLRSKLEDLGPQPSERRAGRHHRNHHPHHPQWEWEDGGWPWLSPNHPGPRQSPLFRGYRQEPHLQQKESHRRGRGRGRGWLHRGDRTPRELVPRVVPPVVEIFPEVKIQPFGYHRPHNGIPLLSWRV